MGECANTQNEEKLLEDLSLMAKVVNMCSHSKAKKLISSHETAEQVAKAAISMCSKEFDMLSKVMCAGFYRKSSRDFDNDPLAMYRLNQYEWEMTSYKDMILNDLRAYVMRERLKK